MATISLPPELERVMIEQANRQGTTVELLALDKLSAYFLPGLCAETASDGETMADFLKDFIGCLDSGDFVPGGARMSENIGEKFAEGMVKKRDSGHL